MVRASGKQLGIAVGIIGAYVLYKNRTTIFYDTQEVGYFKGSQPTYRYHFNTATLARDMTTKIHYDGYQKLIDERYTVKIIDRLKRRRVKVVPDASTETGYRGEGYAKDEVKDTVLAIMPLERFVKRGFSYGPVKDDGWEYGILSSYRYGVTILEPYIGNDGPVYEETSNHRPTRYYPVVGPNPKGWKD